MGTFTTVEKLEKCGVVGILSKTNSDVVPEIYNSMIALQHRGQDAAGIAVWKKQIKAQLGMGLVSEVFESGFKVSGAVGIGHTRYPTAGRLVIGDVQPIVYKNVAVAHNGHIANYSEIKKELEGKGIKVKKTVDSELIAILLAENLEAGVEAAVKKVMEKLDGAYSVVALVDGKLIAFRDRHGLRPLVYGQGQGRIIFASESAALDVNGVELEGDVGCGELAIAEVDGSIIRKKISTPSARHCMFEYVYFSRPDSIINRLSVFETRKKLGEELAKEHPVRADVIIPVPDTARTAAEAFSRCVGIPVEEGLLKNRYIGRTFIMPSQEKRKGAVQMKLNPIRAAIKGKRIVLIDDSIVRGTTLREIVRMVKAAGAKEVHLRITCPPIKAPCFYGVDMSTYKELIANSKSVPEIARFLGVDSLGYLSIEGLRKAIGLPLCTGCLNEDYPTEAAKRLARERKGDSCGCG